MRLGVFDGRDPREIKLVVFWDLPGVPVVKTVRIMQTARVRSLVRGLDHTFHNLKPTCCN